MNNRILGIIGGLALVVALLSPYVLGNSKKVAQLFETAEKLYENSDYEAAIVKYEEALKESNKLLAKVESIDEDFNTLVNFKIAMSYVKLAKQSNDTNYYEKALEHIERADQTVKIAEYEEKLTYLWGYIFYKTGQLKQAVDKLTQLIENFPNSSFVEKAQETIAEINNQLQDLEKEKIEEVVTPTDLTPLWINDLSKFEAFNRKKNTTLVVPNRLRAEKQYTKAAEQYEIFAYTNPSTIEAAYALYWSGWCYYKEAFNDEKLLSKSYNAFQQLIANHGENSYTHEAREKLSEIENLKLKRESNKAIITAEKAVQRAKQLDCKSDVIPKAMTHLGNAKQEYEQGNYTDAFQLASEANDTAKRAINNHKRAKQLVDQGHNYLRQGRLETSIKKANEALRVDPSYQKANKLLEKIKQKYFNQCVHYVEIEEYAKAISCFEKVMDMGLRSKEVYYNLGRAYLKLGEFEKAKAACQAALEIDPTYKDASDLCDSIAN